MSWSDKEIDKVFKENADAKSFEYKDAYWNEMEALLPKSTGKDFLWMFTSFAFIGLLLTAGVVGEMRMTAMNESQSMLIAERSNGASDEINDVQSSELDESSIQLDNSVKVSEADVSEEFEAVFEDSGSENDNSSGLENENASNTGDHLNRQTTVTGFEDTEGISDTSISEESLAKNTDSSSEKERLAETSVLSQEVLSPIDVLSLKPYGNVESIYIERAITSSELPVIALVKPVQTKLYIAALGGVSQSMITPSDKVSSSFGLGAGVQLRKGSFLFNVGLNGTVGIHNDIVLSRESKVYGFGSTYYRSELNYNHIYSLEGDFSIGYQLRKSIFSIGVRPSYVMGTKVGMRMQENESDFIQENHYGYMEGINILGVKPMFGYAYKFGSGLSLGINVGVQLTPLVMDEYVNGMSNKFPIDGQLILKKSLNFKK